MLNLPISDIESVLFIGALGIWAIFLFGGFIFGTLNKEETHKMPTRTRLLSSFTLVIAGWIWFAIAQGTPINVFAGWIALGMTFGFLGDVFMAQVLKVEPHVLYGMLAFGIGHVLYIIGTWMIALPHNLPFPDIQTLVIWWVIGIIGWYIVVYRKSDKSPLVYAALPYSLLLASTVGFTMSLSLLDPSFTLVTVGAILFLLSDLLLAAQLFNNLHFKYIGDAVWFLYAPAQMLIVLGVTLYTLFVPAGA